jgi:hypothetical protein
MIFTASVYNRTALLANEPIVSNAITADFSLCGCGIEGSNIALHLPKP